jgi:hypothetical protein
MIYEGGVVLWDNVGSLIWHEEKTWNDVFYGISGSEIVLENDSARAYMCLSDGRRREISIHQVPRNS